MPTEIQTWERPEGYEPRLPRPLPPPLPEPKKLSGYHERSVNLRQLGYPSYRSYGLHTLKKGGRGVVTICRPCHETVEFVQGAKATFEEAADRLRHLRKRYLQIRQASKEGEQMRAALGLDAAALEAAGQAIRQWLEGR